MLTESKDVRQVPGEKRRRWFSNRTMDLTVWVDDDESIAGFELCYDKGKDERALRWMRGTGFLHERVDDGEGRAGRYKATPVLMPDGSFDAKKISRLFEENSREMDQQIAAVVGRVLSHYPAATDP